ncbi:MAG: DUF3124 domain-containing protein [Myxococcota bacterium]
MKSDPEYPEWFLWLSEHGLTLLILLAVAGLAFVYVRGRTNTEARLDAIEETVQVNPPRAYTPPDPDDYPAGDVSATDLVVQRSVYVPVYSHIYYDGGRPYSLETTLSIRNIDTEDPLYVRTVAYYDTNGALSTKLLDQLIALRPLQTIEFLVERKDATGGSGANFVVDWGAANRQTASPFIEAVMVGRSGTNAISFVSPGRTIDRSITETP